MYKEGQPTLCQKHNDIMYMIKEVKEAIKKGNIAVARDVLNSMNKLAHEAKKAGQHMENRLTTYKRAIEDLGFKREEK